MHNLLLQRVTSYPGDISGSGGDKHDLTVFRDFAPLSLAEADGPLRCDYRLPSPGYPDETFSCDTDRDCSKFVLVLKIIINFVFVGPRNLFLVRDPLLIYLSDLYCAWRAISF